MAENGVTKVRFDLWAVLGFLILSALYGFSYLNSSLAEGRAARIAADQQMDVRVTRLETNYDHIRIGIDELKKGQEKLVDTLNEHERTTKALRKWQDYPATR
jgi:hypothetical protein